MTKKTHAFIASTFQITWILKIDSEKKKEKKFSTFIQDLKFFMLNSCFLNEHLVAKYFKQFFVIFIIAGDFYLSTCPIVNFE